MQVKLLMTWDIKPGRDHEYFEFVVREWVPGITRLGVQPIEAWFAVYGNCPQVMTGVLAKDLETMKHIIAGDEWADLHERLLEYVDNYEQKIIRASEGFQL